MVVFFSIVLFFFWGGSFHHQQPQTLLSWDTTPKNLTMMIAVDQWAELKTHFHPHDVLVQTFIVTRHPGEYLNWGERVWWVWFWGQKSYRTPQFRWRWMSGVGVGVLSTSITQHLELLIILAAAIATESTWTLENKSWTRRVCLWTSFEAKIYYWVLLSWYMFEIEQQHIFCK